MLYNNTNVVIIILFIMLMEVRRRW